MALILTCRLSISRQHERHGSHNGNSSNFNLDSLVQPSFNNSPTRIQMIRCKLVWLVVTGRFSKKKKHWHLGFPCFQYYIRRYRRRETHKGYGEEATECFDLVMDDVENKTSTLKWDWLISTRLKSRPKLTGSSSAGGIIRPWSECHANHGIVGNYLRIPGLPWTHPRRRYWVIASLGLIPIFFLPFFLFTFLITSLTFPKKIFLQNKTGFSFIFSNLGDFSLISKSRSPLTLGLISEQLYGYTGVAKSWSFRPSTLQRRLSSRDANISPSVVYTVRYFIKANAFRASGYVRTAHYDGCMWML